MPRYVAFLRAINVGGRVVKMERLRALFAGLGLDGAETFIASGNVVFDAPGGPAPALEERIERALRAGLGYDVATFLRTPAEVAAAAAHDPFPGLAPDGEGALHVGFLKAAPDAEARGRLRALETDLDALAVHGREVYWALRMRVSDSRVSGARIEKALGAPTTLRNVTTVRRLTAKYPAY